jgi:methylated-DNA-[protein]-cysteine S-methyltransferase
MNAIGFTQFETSIGHCAIAWGSGGIVGIWLPEASESETRARLRRRLPDAEETAPPAPVVEAIAGMTALLSGQRRDLSGVDLDMSDVPEFHRRVYAIAREIPPGETLTYGEIASRLGDPSQARAVGQALGQNRFPIVIPCHRVLAAGAKSGGFSAPGGVATKLRLLAIEGARASAIPTLFDQG